MSIIDDTETNEKDPLVIVERHYNDVLGSLDSLCGAALKADTGDYVEAQAPEAFKQIRFRMHLLESFFHARRTPPLKVVGRAQ